MEGKRKLINMYPVDIEIVERVQRNYDCSFTAAARMIIRDWGKRFDAVDYALAAGKIMPHEHKQRIGELTTLTGFTG